MKTIPQEPGLDSTLAFAKDGYRFISKRCERHNSDIFQTRLMLKNALCMRGEAAARIFYDNSLFQREGAMPGRVQKTLLGVGGVQGLDDEAHRHRKQAFMSLMSPKHLQNLCDRIVNEWQARIPLWESRDRIELFYQANEILCRATCDWAGVPLTDSDLEEKTLGFMAEIDSAAAVGPRHWKGRAARKHLDGWLAHIIEQIRDGKLAPAADCAAAVFAGYRDPQGKLLDAHTAAVELNNCIRPTIAVARYITFAALALHENPRYHQQLKTGNNDQALLWFVQEVRRFYPFFPSLAAIARKDFEWNGFSIPKGQWVILDLYGTNHDPATWDNPEQFRPERFNDWDESPNNFIPQGGGDHHHHHRCAGEWMTIEIMKAAVRILTQSMTYDVPPQDLGINLRRLPAIPKSRFLMSNIRPLLPETVDAPPANSEKAI